VKKLVIILIVGALVIPSRRAAAQELLVPPAEGPPRLELPAVGSGSRGSASRGALPRDATPSPTPEQPTQELLADPLALGDFESGLQPFDSSNDYQILDCEPALLESSGTWLRRGFWYSEFDVLLMDRVWRRDNFILAFQPLENVGSPFGTGTTGNSLIVEGGRSGAELTPRLNIGRFLFRDYKNRDHAMEFVAYGGGQWSASSRLDAVAGGTLSTGSYTILENDFRIDVVRLPMDRGNISFDGATSMQYSYDSRFNNFELNYHVKSRMLKDRMELEPSGHWVRRAQPSTSRSLIAGIRYFNLSEDFDWDAFGINDANGDAQTGNYRVRANNDLIGTQIGFSWTYETARWSLGAKNKSGIYLNKTNVESSFEVTGGVTSGDNDVNVDNLSFISESSLIGKWHLRPNFSLRAGLEVMFVTSVANASEQMNFIPVSTSQLVANGDSTYMGGLIGFEGYW